MKIAIGALLILAAAPAAAAVNLVTNGGFETGDFTGWTQFGNTDDTSVVDFNTISGQFVAYLGPVGTPGGITQTIATLPGRSYTLTFALAGFGASEGEGSSAITFDAAVGGTSLLSLDAANGSPQFFSYGFKASSAKTALTFTFRNDPDFWYLDDVSVTSAVPEPATWAMLILGFGLVGTAMRRQRVATTIA